MMSKRSCNRNQVIRPERPKSNKIDIKKSKFQIFQPKQQLSDQQTEIILYRTLQLQIMKKINNFTLDDILRRRILNSSTKPIEKTSSAQKSKPHQEDDFYEFNQNQLLMNVFEEFKNCANSTPPTFSHETKVRLVQIIGKKLNLRLNSTRMAQKIKIKKFQHIQLIDKPPNSNKKKELNNITIDSKQLDCSPSNNSRLFYTNKKSSYFVLSGNLYIYEKNLKEDGKRKQSYEQSISDETIFYTWKQFYLEYPSYKRVNTVSQFCGYGQVFSQNKPFTQQESIYYDKDGPLQRQNTSSYKSHQLTLVEDALIVEIQNPQYDDEYINLAGMDYEKMAETIESFPIFNSLGRKIRNFVQFFELKEYQRNQEIYTVGGPVNKFYLIIKGEICFESNNTNSIKSPLSSPKESRKNSIHIQMNIKTEMVSSGNYFGQEEIIFNVPQRLLTAKCKSSKCQILEVSKDKLEKMLEYSDFYEVVKKGAEIKFRQRLAKLQKNKQIRNKFVLTQFNQEIDQSGKKVPLQISTVPLFGAPKRSIDGRYKVMHGQVIRQFSKQQKEKMSEDVHFSMLKVNPDMYDKTVDKFRKYNIKPREKYVPEVNWQLKRVWKVLNLENILREQAQVSSPQGRKFYDSHKRYMYHIKQSKSLRPKTSSSTYRTKLQYIAYLQKFKGQK